MEKPICLIAGATDGIGKATAVALANKGFSLVLGARDAAKAEEVRREIASATGNADIDYLIADLRSLAQVRRLAETFRQRYPRLDVLINNAGIFAHQRVITEDGYDATFQVNYLSLFYLTHLLLDELKKSREGRIINLCSSVYANGKLDIQNLPNKKLLSTFASYANSKLLVLLFTIELARRLEGTRVTANAVHPGVVKTPMLLRAPGLFRIATYLTLPFAIAPEEGAATSVFLASSPDVRGVSGKYFTRSTETAFKTRFNTPEDREAVWDLTLRLLGLDAPRLRQVSGQ